jgi:hypothetical protein
MFSIITNIYKKKTKGLKNIDEPMLMRVWQEIEYCSDVYSVTHGTSLVVKKNFFSFPVAVNNFIKVGPLVFLL